MRIVPPIRPVRSGKILDTNLINHMIQRTEYGAELLARYKMVAGTNMFVEYAANGLGISYLTALAGGAGNPVSSGSAGTGIGGAGTGTGGAGAGSGGSGTPQPVTPPYRIVGAYLVGPRFFPFIYNGSTFALPKIPFLTDNVVDGFADVDGLNIVGNARVNNVRVGFIYNGTTFTTFSVPDLQSVGGIDGSNIVGTRIVENITRGFLYNGSGFNDIFDSNNLATFPSKISGSNIVGFVISPGGGQKAFVYNGSSFTTFMVPGGDFTIADGIDGSNIVGRTRINGIRLGFLYDGSNFTTFSVPGATATEAYGIYGSNIVGVYESPAGIRGFLYNGSTFTDIFVPNCNRTYAYGIG